MQNHRGFSLIELVIVIVISSIMVAVSVKMLATGFSAFLTGNNVASAEQQVIRALERMTRDIRAVRSPSDISTATSSQFTFTNLSGTSISYTLSGSSLMLNSNILADGIGSLTFSYYDLNGNTTATASAIRYVEISLNVTQSNANFTAGTAVSLEALS